MIATKALANPVSPRVGKPQARNCVHSTTSVTLLGQHESGNPDHTELAAVSAKCLEPYLLTGALGWILRGQGTKSDPALPTRLAVFLGDLTQTVLSALHVPPTFGSFPAGPAPR